MTERRGRYLWTAIVVPFLYFGTVIVSAFLYPGYSHVTQYASELGSSDAPYPVIFNAGTILTGLAAMASGVSLHRAMVGLGGHRALAFLTALCLVLFGASLIVGGLFPMPDPRHGSFGVGMVVHLAPFALAAAVWQRPSLRAFSWFLLANGVAMLALLAVMMGAGALVTRSNVGLFQRSYALTVFPWVGLAGYVLRKRLRPSRDRKNERDMVVT